MMQSQPLISVIVPVYNVAPYLESCVSSILASTYVHLELLLVDDGSTDGSGALCDELAQRDARIRVIHQPENGGQGKARNTGLDACQGDYISFIDSDDTIHPRMLERLYELLTTYQASISFCSRKVISDWLPDVHEDTGVHVFRDGVVDVSLLGNGDDLSSPVLKLYKRAIFEHLRFPETHWAEDLYIVPDYLSLAPVIAYTSEQLYYYSLRKDNISFGQQTHERMDFQIQAYQRLFAYYRSKAFDEQRFARYVLFSYAQAWRSFSDIRSRFRYWKGYLRFFLQNVRIALRPGSLLFVLSPPLYDYLFRLRQRK